MHVCWVEYVPCIPILFDHADVSLMLVIVRVFLVYGHEFYYRKEVEFDLKDVYIEPLADFQDLCTCEEGMDMCAPDGGFYSRHVSLLGVFNDPKMTYVDRKQRRMTPHSNRFKCLSKCVEARHVLGICTTCMFRVVDV